MSIPAGPGLAWGIDGKPAAVLYRSPWPLRWL